MRASGTPHNRAYAPFSARTGSSGIVYAFEGTFLDAVLRMRFTQEAGDAAGGAAAEPFTARSETDPFLRVWLPLLAKTAPVIGNVGENGRVDCIKLDG